MIQRVLERSAKDREEAEKGGHKYKPGDEVILGDSGARVRIINKVMMFDRSEKGNLPKELRFKGDRTLEQLGVKKVPGYNVESSGWHGSESDKNTPGSWAGRIYEWGIKEKATGLRAIKTEKAANEPLIKTKNGIAENPETKETSAATLLGERISGWAGKPVKIEEVQPQSLSPELKEALGAVDNALGVKTHIIEPKTEGIENFGGAAFGDKNLFVSAKVDSPITTVLMHEFTHDLAANRPELYRELAFEAAKGDIEGFKKQLEKDGYKNIDSAGAIEELTANAVGDAFNDPKFLDALAKRNPTVFRRIADAFIRFLNTLKEKIGLGSEKYLKDVDAFREKLLDVLEKYQPGEGKALARQEPKWYKTAEEADKIWHKTPKYEPSAKERWQARATKWVNQYKPLEYLNRAAEKLGQKISEKLNIYGAMTLHKSRVAFETSHDLTNYEQPFITELKAIADKLGMEPKKAYETFNNYVAGKHALERNALLDLQNARLTPEAQKARSQLMLDVFEGKVKPEDYIGKLKEIVYEPGAKIEKGGMRAGSGLTDTEANKLIKNALGDGLTKEEAEKLNKALDAVRNRTLENGRLSGRYTPEEQRIQQSYGFKYYLPFKGFADEGPMGIDASRRPYGAFNKDVSYMEGRETLSKTPLDNLLADLAASSRDKANKDVTEVVKNAAANKIINSKLKVKTRTYDIHNMIKDALEGGGKLSDIDSIFRNPNTIVHNAGRFRSVMEFHPDSKELAAIKASQKEDTLDGFSKAVGMATNLYARAKTAYSPIFDISTALLRDTTTYPLFGLIEHGPAVAARYVKNVIRYGGPLGAWRTYFSLGHGEKTFGEIEKMAQDNPNSFAGWAYRLAKTGGGLEFRNELNNVKRAETLAKELEAESKNPLLKGAKSVGKTFIGYLDALATSAIATGRVAMFKALVETGKISEREAGLYTKELLNFQQTSEMGRQMNAYYAFWRAGITNADRLYKLTHDAKGDLDYKRLGKLITFGGGAAAVWWNAVLKQYYGDDAKKLTADTISKNFVLPNPWGDPIKIPMGLGLPRLMFGLGTLATRLAEGSIDKTDALEAAKNVLFENTGPLRPSESPKSATAGDRALDLLMAIVPSVGRPVAEIGRNQDVFGKPIGPQPSYHDTRFRSESGRQATPSEWKWLANELREYTGADVYPESLEYIANSYGAGFMTELLRGFNLKNKEERGVETGLTDAPFIPRLTTKDIKYSTQTQYREKRDELQNVVKEAQTYKDAGKPVPLTLQKSLDKEKEFAKANAEHNKALKAVEGNNLLSPEAKAAQLKRIESQWERTQAGLIR